MSSLYFTKMPLSRRYKDKDLCTICKHRVKVKILLGKRTDKICPLRV